MTIEEVAEEMEAELDFLRFFYSAAGESFGPADSDIYRMIGEDYKNESGRDLPPDYRPRDE
jgi:hypothetical protein